jgi:hypothetical protein
MVKTKSLGRRYVSAKVIFRGNVFQVAVVCDLFDVDEVLSNEDDVIEILVSDAGRALTRQRWGAERSPS